MDKLIRGISVNKDIRFFAIESTEVVRKAQELHELDPVSTVIMGRLLTAALMMASDLKASENLVTLKIKSDGLINTVLTTSDRSGTVKGFLRSRTDIDKTGKEEIVSIKETLGKGQLTVIKDLGLKKPYVGMVELNYGTIGRDLTYYFAKQTPSSVGLGVLLDEEQVRQAGGFIIQLMPDAPESTIATLESNLNSFPNYTDVLDMGFTSKEIIERYLLKGLEPLFLEEVGVQYKCDCSKQKFTEGLSLLSEDDLKEMIKAGKDINVNCHFCNSDYKFSVDELKTILSGKK